ncbi:MAG: O-antigen ligase family protein [Candidatus Promineifilaceae bacterium]|nr:O-antigen ligase family protein [Candidatus Promineifilaceae bacterium]
MSQKAPRRNVWLAGFFLVLALLALLGTGALVQHRAFQTRGIPDGLPPPIPHGGARLALNVNLQQYDPQTLDTVLARIAATGITTLKQPFFYDPQGFDWQQADQIMAAVAAHDLHLVPLLDGDPATDFAPPADPNAFATWAGTFAGRYGDSLWAYIIWDEPNLDSHWGLQAVDPAAYGALLTAASTAIRAVDPDALIAAAPLAPTLERGPDELAAPIFLQKLYEAGAGNAFDVLAGKPYGFDTGPDDRRVNLDILNFSQVVLLREVMVRHGDEHKALWAGSWGWNSLPADLQPAHSRWDFVSEEEQLEWTIAAVQRARREWPWMGWMFLESWEPAAPPADPFWGFSVADRSLEAALRDFGGDLARSETIAYPGFHLARPGGAGQSYEGNWTFAPEFGADIPVGADRAERNATATLNFWGSDIGVRVRFGNLRARFYVLIDGQPAEALPHDGSGATLILTAPDPEAAGIDMEVVARNLEPGPHTLTLIAHRGWGQWALNGYSVAYHPPASAYRLGVVTLALLALVAFLLAGLSLRPLWPARGEENGAPSAVRKRRDGVALIAVISPRKWRTWSGRTVRTYLDLSDYSQLALTAAVAAFFYFSPWSVVSLATLVLLFFLIYARPPWGLALSAFSFPFWTWDVVKPLLGYTFPPVEIFLLVTFGAWMLRQLTDRLSHHLARRPRAASRRELLLARRIRATMHAWRKTLVAADFAVLLFVGTATVSLLFTERLGVALHEWRVVIVEPALFYLLFRGVSLREGEVWAVVDAFVLGGVVVAGYGLSLYVACQATPFLDAPCTQVITPTAGLDRLRSLYGSANNLALYLGRILPFLLAVALLGIGWARRRLLYILALLPVGVALLLTFSKGALFLGVPASLVVIFFLSQRRRAWPSVVALTLLAALAVFVALNVPSLATRFDIRGATSTTRFYLWQASAEMFLDHPLFGVGLDNFLYEYRDHYILEPATAEPNLNHPHNLLLDFATRLGLAGLGSGIILFAALARNLFRLQRAPLPVGRPLAIAIAAAFADMLLHGLVDHSFFLIDLAFAFFLMLALSEWLRQRQQESTPVESG